MRTSSWIFISEKKIVPSWIFKLKNNIYQSLSSEVKKWMWSKHILDTLYIHTLSYTKKIKQIIDHYMSMYVIQYQRMHSYKNIRKQVLSPTQNKVKESKTDFFQHAMRNVLRLITQWNYLFQRYWKSLHRKLDGSITFPFIASTPLALWYCMLDLFLSFSY